MHTCHKKLVLLYVMANKKSILNDPIARTTSKLISHGLNSPTAERLAILGETTKSLRSKSLPELQQLGISDVEAKLIFSKRPPIPSKILLKVLADSRWTCCICRNPHQGVIVHHIESWSTSRNHDFDNLALLCLQCHDLAHSKKTLSQNLTPNILRDLRDNWYAKGSQNSISPWEETEQVNSSQNQSNLNLGVENSESNVDLDYRMAEFKGGMIFMDPTRINTFLYYHLLLEQKRRRFTDPKKSISSKHSTQLSGAILNSSTFHQALELSNLLENNGLVSLNRPISLPAFNLDDRYFREQVLATKLIFTKDKVEPLTGMNHLTVWVADPDPKDLGMEDLYEFTGSFLYLIESIGDYQGIGNFLSGVSALHALCNHVKGHSFFDTSLNQGEGKETFGRWNYIHPIEKLKSLGAFEIESRFIDVLYVSRYFTDEQSYECKGKNYRVCDLLGYPLFIKEGQRLI